MNSLRWKAMLVLLISQFFWALAAHASDYTVAYAIDAGGRKETGIVDRCNIQQGCDIKLRTEAISIRLAPTDRDRIVRITISGSQPSCCFFYDGAESVSRDFESLIDLNIYEGHARKRNEFVENLHFGVLFLQFSEAE